MIAVVISAAAPKSPIVLERIEMEVEKGKRYKRYVVVATENILGFNYLDGGFSGDEVLQRILHRDNF